MNRTKIKLALRIKHPKENWENIANKLCLTPKSKWSAGDINKANRVKDFTYCVFRLYEGIDFVDDVIERSVAEVIEFKEYFNYIYETGGTIEFSIGIFNQKNTGFIINEKLMEQLLELKLELLFEIYT